LSRPGNRRSVHAHETVIQEARVNEAWTQLAAGEITARARSTGRAGRGDSVRGGSAPRTRAASAANALPVMLHGWIVTRIRCRPAIVGRSLSEDTMSETLRKMAPDYSSELWNSTGSSVIEQE
jgi:hypothetical protein